VTELLRGVHDQQDRQICQFNKVVREQFEAFERQKCLIRKGAVGARNKAPPSY
jgi:hypothetical protein